MHSLTKRHVTADEIAALVQHGTGADVDVRDYTEFTDSFFNAVYAVTLTDGQELVLKVAPDPGQLATTILPSTNPSAGTRWTSWTRSCASSSRLA